MPEQTSERTRCPFYGFHQVQVLESSPTLVDQQGNQCALRLGYSACCMEMNGEAPAWSKCTFLNTPELARRVKRLRQLGRIYPGELRPRGDQRADWVDEPARPGLLQRIGKFFGKKLVLQSGQGGWTGIPFEDWSRERTQ